MMLNDLTLMKLLAETRQREMADLSRRHGRRKSGR